MPQQSTRNNKSAKFNKITTNEKEKFKRTGRECDEARHLDFSEKQHLEDPPRQGDIRSDGLEAEPPTEGLPVENISDGDGLAAKEMQPKQAIDSTRSLPRQSPLLR